MVKISLKEIPKVLLGTSPFIGAGQFGLRALEYYKNFYLNPSNIKKIARRSFEVGVKGVQLLPLKPVINAIDELLKEGLEFKIVSTITFEGFKKNLLEEVKKLNPVAILLHAEVADRCNEVVMRNLLREIQLKGYLAGFATHQPLKTLSWIKDTNLEYDIIMTPLNFVGEFIDGKLEDLIEVLRMLNRFVIVKKALAAGKLKPKEALDYIVKLNCVNAVALGVTSEKEVEETLVFAKKLFGED
ncbi:MAG: hypothetical protein N3E48_02935 [Candidatus Bathyarchaeota archaeon]|nr:hypothetical protein [Candidatus Bathyarchaeota archaeon]